jgi:integrase/recombinase XerD
MKKKIILRRLFHRGRRRLAIVFDFDPELAAIVRKIDGSAWSNTNKCWHCDDNEETLKRILNLFRERAEVDISEVASKDDKSETVEANIVGVISPPGVSEIIEDESELSSERKWERKTNRSSRRSSVEFNINEEDGRLLVKFTGPHEADWIRELNDYGRANYDRIHGDWVLPWSRITVDSLSDYFASQDVDVIVKKRDVPSALKESRECIGNDIRDRILGREALKGLDLVRDHLAERRYSERTIGSYLALLALFFKYYNEKDPSYITKKEVTAFMQDHVVRLSYSCSYQNQIISAIKIYYDLLGKSRIELGGWERPRRSRALPKVFSKEEVMKILGSARNVKHKLILWLIYSCGLRRGEVINIKLTDLERDRGILHIRQGKGKVDRIVPVPGKVWEKIGSYLSSYKPRIYLIEGQGGGKYSAESVYSVFKHALRRTGIRKDLGVHCLRHSYATHLHEGGLDIRFIQELLGHKSSRTTEIYTHVSRRDLFSVRSPIEDMDLD